MNSFYVESVVEDEINIMMFIKIIELVLIMYIFCVYYNIFDVGCKKV